MVYIHKKKPILIMKLYTDFKSFNSKKLFEADFFKDVKSSGKFGEVETGLEIETTSVEISYDIPNDILDEIIDKLKSEPSNVLDFDSMSRDVIAKKIINVILHKYTKPENIDIFDLQGEDEDSDFDLEGETPTLDGLKENFDPEIEEKEEIEIDTVNPGADDLGKNKNKVLDFKDFANDEYKEECGLELDDEITKLQEMDATPEEIEDFKEKFENGEVKSAEEFADSYMYEDEEGSETMEHNGNFGQEEEDDEFKENDGTHDDTELGIDEDDETKITPVVKESIKSFDEFIKNKKK